MNLQANRHDIIYEINKILIRIVYLKNKAQYQILLHRIKT